MLSIVLPSIASELPIFTVKPFFAKMGLKSKEVLEILCILHPYIVGRIVFFFFFFSGRVISIDQKRHLKQETGVSLFDLA